MDNYTLRLVVKSLNFRMSFQLNVYSLIPSAENRRRLILCQKTI